MSAEENVVGYRFAGDIEVKNVFMVSQGGEKIDLGPIISEINIFQNMFNHYLQCDVVISDAVALLNELRGDPQNGIQGGFNGGETLVVSYKTKSDSIDYKTHLFGIYEISDRTRLDDKNEAYVLNAISIEAYQSSTQKISRAYGGNQGNIISNMVKSVVGEYIYNRPVQEILTQYAQVVGVTVFKKVDIYPTTGFQRFVIPNLTVDDTIDFFAIESDSDNHIPLFFFYEDTDGFKFVDVNTLVQQPPRERYVYVSTNVPEEKPNKDNDSDENIVVRDYQKIISFDVIRQTNILDNAKSGLFRQKTINLDILRKNKSEVVFDYEKAHGRFNTLQKLRIPGSVNGDPVIHMFNSRIGHDNGVFQSENHLPKRINQITPYSTSYRKHIFNTLVNVTVPGNSELLAGDTVFLDIPTATTLDKEDGRRDKYLSGKYLVTSVRHIFGGKTGETFTTVFECTKDTGIQI